MQRFAAHGSTTYATVAGVPANWRHEAAAHQRGDHTVAGIDEAGRGPWAGPVVAAAVVVTRRRFAVRIDDSKRLTARQREAAYAVILEQAHVGVGIVDQYVIDRINILQATRHAMCAALDNMRVRPQLVLVDGRMPQLTPIRQLSIVQGERHSLSIACASIVAKVTRDRLMHFCDRLFPAYGFARHKGYGTRHHRDCLHAHGPSPLHRMTFQPVAACLS